MRVVIAGCGRVGSTLAESLSREEHDVVVVDRSDNALASLGKGFNGSTIRGEAYDVSVLESAGIERADVFLAVTDSDNANLMAVEVATRVFSVPRAVARLYDPAREQAYRTLGIRHVTGTKMIADVLHDHVVKGEATLPTTLPDGDVEIVELTLTDACRGMTVGEIEIRGALRVATVSRAGTASIPDRRFSLQGGDVVVVAARRSARRRISHLIEES